VMYRGYEIRRDDCGWTAWMDGTLASRAVSEEAVKHVIDLIVEAEQRAADSGYVCPV